MTQQFDEWELSSGLPLAGKDVTITKAEFRIDNSYALNAVVLSLEYTPDEGAAQTQLYSLGKGWKIVEKGGAVIHENDSATKKPTFSEQSNYGRFIKAVKGVNGARDLIASRGSLRSAETWVGTRWTLGTVKYKPNSGKDAEFKDLIVPAALLGEAAGVAGSTAPGGAAARGGVALADEDRDYLAGLAGAVLANGDDYDTFMATAFDDPRVLASSAMQAAVTDTSDQSVWAQTVAGYESVEAKASGEAE